MIATQKSTFKSFLLLPLASIFLGACNKPAAETPRAHNIVRDESAARTEATQAFRNLGTTLKERLQAAMKDEGPIAAVSVCHKDAPEIALSVSQEVGFKVGRSSHRLRNPGNTPNPAVAQYLEKYATQPAKDAPVEAVLAGGVWTVVAPIPTEAICLTCHGQPEDLSPELKEELRAKYPEDQALGFRAGDLRGVFWAEIPETSPTTQQDPK